VQHLRQGIPVLLGEGETPSNTVYVDNVVEAILRSLAAPDEAVAGQTFLIGDDDGCTWHDYHRCYAEALGLEMHSVPTEALAELRGAQRGGPLAWLLAWPRALKTIATSTECLALAGKVLQTDPPGWWLRSLFQWVPGLKDGLARLLRPERAPVYQRQQEASAPLPPVELLEFYSGRAAVCADKARRVLGYAPPVCRDRAMALTLAWVKQAGL
jgi:nucleoside-diphosphate-sugar epimerase